MDDFVKTVVAAGPCPNHQALPGQPCWTIHRLKDSRLELPAICNRRARAAGFNAPIDPRSLTRKRPV